MGDRTWVRITYAEQSEPAVMEAFNWQPSQVQFLDIREEHGIATANLDQLNWGGIDEMRALAKKGVTFLAHSGAGGSYGEALSAGCRGGFVEVSAHEGDPVCLVRDDGKADPEGMQHIRTYQRLSRKANRELQRIRATHKEAAET